MLPQQIILAIALFTLQLFSVAYAQDNLCIDQAQNNPEIEKCGELIITPLENKVESEFQRLEDKYKGNASMLATLKNTRQSWNAYRNMQCIFEGMAAVNGQSKKPLPLKANKSFTKCVSRTLLEMHATLLNF
jgi:uncharacterized protein YecT (DUF1311 family)